MWTREQTREVARNRLKKERRRQAALKDRRDRAQQHARELAVQIAAADDSVRRIWGFGSTFDQALPYRQTSDIDLACEGGDIRAWKTAQASPWDVDWVELDDQEASMVQSVTSRGVLLYER